MLYTIYQVTHIESDKCYIGKHQTENPNDGYMGSGQLIRRAVKKLGAEAFQKEVLHVFETEEEMNAKEAELVTEEFCSRDDTYNLCPGGNGGWGYVNRYQSVDHKRNVGSLGGLVSGSSVGKVYGAINFKAAHAAGKIKYATFTGKSHSSSTRQKMAKSQKTVSRTGSNNPNWGMWVTNGIDQIFIKDKTITIPSGYVPGKLNSRRAIRALNKRELLL